MEVNENLIILFNVCEKKFEEQFEFKIRELSFDKVAVYLHKPKDSSSLAVTRILFGLAMLFDTPDERGGATMERRWGDPKICHFPLVPFVTALPMPYMALVYAALWFGALGIMLGYRYRVTSFTFVVCYWYLLLVEKSFWNNHSYLFGLVAFLLACTDASCYWSIDAHLDPTKRNTTVPYWNYFLLKYQFFILYFMAGLKKGTAEWLSGYSVQNLSEHWVFAPFKLFLTVSQTDYLVVHWFIFAFDLTVAGWMMCSRSRHIAMLLCALFHLMNSRLFRIGMFPWVCLATMPLFYPFDWPKLAIKYVKDKMETNKEIVFGYLSEFSKKQCERSKSKDGAENDQLEEENRKELCSSNNIDHLNDDEDDDDVFIKEKNPEELFKKIICKSKIPNHKSKNLLEKCNNVDDKAIQYNMSTIYFITIYVVLQAFLPYSHFITKGYNNWTNGLYGYSWDMMVHTWETHSVVVKVVDNDRNAEFYVDPYLFTANDRWTRHGDMVYQYARCMEEKIVQSNKRKIGKILNISIYIDVWCSMNGRFVQRMFDPKVDLLRASWSPLKPTQYLMPVLDEAVHWRRTLDELREQVTSWGEHSYVTFFADFPGYDQEKFIPSEVRNVTLTVLGGDVAFEHEVTDLFIGHTSRLAEGDRIEVASGKFHRVLNIGDAAAFYMYTYHNVSATATMERGTAANASILPIGSELMQRIGNMAKFAGVVAKGIVKIFM